MKKHFIYLILLFAFVLTVGCKHTPVNPITPTTPTTPFKADIKTLVGKWNYKSHEFKLYVNGIATAADPYTYINGEYIQFNTDGTGKDYNNSFTYTLKDNQLTINYSAHVDAAGVTINGETQICTIKELSANKLTLYYDFTVKDSKNLSNGNTVTQYLSR